MSHISGSGGSSGGLSDILGGFGSLLGGIANQREFQDTKNQITDSSSFNPLGGSGFGGSVGFGGGAGQFQGDAQTQLLQQLLGGAAQQGFGGGLFQNQGFQQAFQGNDILGALQQAQGGLQQQQGSTALGGLGGLFGQSQGLSNLFAGQLAGGPQDLSGGLQNALFGQGFANQQAAGDSQSIFNSELANFRAAAEPGNTQFIQGLENRLFSQGRLGSSGGAGQFGQAVDAIGRQDIGFQQAARQTGLQQQNFLSNLGGQQIGQGQNFLGQSLGQFGQIGNFAQQFGQQAGGFENQAFQQQLGALQQNQSAGNQRLQNSLGLFGLGSQVQNTGFNQGLGAAGAIQGQNQFGLDAILAFMNSENQRIGAVGESNQALASLQGQQGGGIGGLISGALGAIGPLAGLFASDERLKDNIKKIGMFGDFNWYEWDWSEEAIEMGILDQPNFGVIAQEVAKIKPKAVSMTKSGYLQVNYRELV